MSQGFRFKTLQDSWEGRFQERGQGSLETEELGEPTAWGRLAVRDLTANEGDESDPGLVPGLGRAPEKEMPPHPVSLPGKSTDRGILMGYSSQS